MAPIVWWIVLLNSISVAMTTEMKSLAHFQVEPILNETCACCYCCCGCCNSSTAEELAAGSPLMSALFTHRYMCVCNRYDRQMSLCDSRGESRWWIAHSFVDIASVVVWYVRSSGCANVFKVHFLVIVARSWFNRREGADELTDERTGWEAAG